MQVNTFSTYDCNHSLEREYPPDGCGLSRILLSKIKSAEEIKEHVFHLLDDHDVQPTSFHYHAACNQKLDPEILQHLVTKGPTPLYSTCETMMSKYHGWPAYHKYLAILNRSLSKEEQTSLEKRYPLTRA